MADISLTFDANTAPFLNGVKEIRASVNTLSQTIKEKREELVQFSANLSMIFHGVKSAAALAGRMLSAPLQEFSRWEDAATRFAPLVGGLEAAKEVASHLRDEAANGTMSLEQLASVAGRLSTVFKNSADVKKWTTAFHDLSAGTGLDINELIGNFVKSKARGRFESELMDMLAQKGVNIFPYLEEQTGLAGKALQKAAVEGKLAWSEVEKAILRVSTGTGQFAGQASAMSNTFGGSVGTMVANWKILLAEFAKPIAENLTPKIQSLGKLLSESRGSAERFGNALTTLGPIALALAGSFSVFKGAILSVLAAMNPVVASVAAFAGIAGMIGFEAWIHSMKEETREAEKLIDANKRLQASFDSVSGAKNAAQLKDAAQQARRLVDVLEEAGTSLNTDLIRENIKALEAKTRAEIALAAATEKRAAAEAKSAENNRKAQELWTKISTERQQAQDKRALETAPLQARPDLLLKQNGFASYDAFAEWLNNHRARMDEGLKSNQGSEWLVGEVNRLEQLNEQYFTLVEAANAAAEAQAAAQNEAYAKAEAAKRAAQTRVDLLRAEISGNAKLAAEIKTRERYETLLNQHLAAGIDYGKARELAAQEAAAEYTQTRSSGGNAVGTGLVGDELASVGGGRSMHVGGDVAASVARNQLSVMRTMANYLAGIRDNTSRTTAAFA